MEPSYGFLAWSPGVRGGVYTCLHWCPKQGESVEGVEYLVGRGLTCGVVSHHKEEGSVHDDLLRGHSG